MMKKMIFALLVLALLPCTCGYAATTEEITFYGLEWLTTSPTDFVQYVYGTLLDGKSSRENDYIISDSLAQIFDITDEYGHLSYVDGYSILVVGLDDMVEVAGHTVSYITANALYGVDENGKIINDPACGKLVNAIYEFDDLFGEDLFLDSTAGCAEIVNLLTDKYGQPNMRYTDGIQMINPDASQHSLVWFGKNGTYVVLTHHYDNGRLSIEYGTMAFWGELEAYEPNGL